MVYGASGSVTSKACRHYRLGTDRDSETTDKIQKHGSPLFILTLGNRNTG